MDARALLIIASVVLSGCVLSPRDGTILENRSDRFPFQIVYPLDDEDVPSSPADQKDRSEVRLDVLLPGADVETDVLCSIEPAGTLIQIRRTCAPAMPIRLALVDLRRRSNETPTAIELIGIPFLDSFKAPGAPPAPGIDAAFVGVNPTYELGQSQVETISDGAGRPLIHLSIDGVRIADSLWQSCQAPGASCPPDAQFFARIRAFITFGNVSPFAGPGVDGSNPPIPPFEDRISGLEKIEKAIPFATDEATDVCLVNGFFGTEGAAAVVVDCPSSDRGFVEIYARN